MNRNVNTMASILRDFTRTSPHMFFGYKVVEDPKEFMEDVYKIIETVWVTSLEKVELSAYQLKDVSQVRYTQWKGNRTVEAGPID